MPRFVILSAMLSLGVVLSPLAVHAQETYSAPADDDGWHFQVTPYFLAAGLDGRVGIASVSAFMDVPFADVFDHLDMGFMAMAQARKGRWWIGLDALYFKLSDVGSTTVTGPFGGVGVDGAVEAAMTQQIYQPTLGYRLIDDELTLDAYYGARYTALDTELNIAISSALPSFPGGESTIAADVSWWDFVIGGHVVVPLAERLTLEGVADVGAVDEGAELTYQWIAAGSWRFSDTFSARLGYRYFSQYYNEELFRWDMVASGVVAGVGIAF